MKKLVAILLVVLALASASPLFAQAAKPVKVAVIFFDFANTYLSYMRGGMKNFESTLGSSVQIDYVDSRNDQPTQNDQIDTLIAKGIDVLAINPVDPKAASTMIAKAKARNIPIVFFNRCPDEADILSYDKDWYVGTTPEESGVIQAQMIMNAWKARPSLDKNKDGKMQYVILKGTPGHPDAEARTKLVVETMQKAGFPIEQLALQPANFKTDDAKNIMETWLGRFGDKTEMVICNNDAMALGAVEALKSAGYFTGKKYMGVVGINALSTVVPLIKDDIMLGSVLSDPNNEAQAILLMAVNLVRGGDVLKGVKNGILGTFRDVRMPYFEIVKSNIEVAEAAYKKTETK
ncbi:MAG: galactose ABC transporter substrate-binding protein [Spirochaetes bacterium]|nr:galactose ABC transporter substrate-binding protein [Spirochaetota bacterium]